MEFDIESAERMKKLTQNILALLEEDFPNTRIRFALTFRAIDARETMEQAFKAMLEGDENSREEVLRKIMLNNDDVKASCMVGNGNKSDMTELLVRSLAEITGKTPAHYYSENDGPITRIDENGNPIQERH